MIYLFIVVLCLFACIVEYVTSKHSFHNVWLQVHYSLGQVEPNETFSMIITVENRSWMPKLFMQVSSKLPQTILIADKEWEEKFSNTQLGYTQFSISFFMMPHQRKVITIPLKATKRGRYTCRSVYLTSGDFFGLSSSIKSFDIPLAITVIPEKSNNENFDEVFGGMMGEMSVRRWMYEDPILIKGFQEYSGREPMKSISWNQSAKRGSLIVSQYDHTAEPHILVLLYLDCEKGETYEKAFSKVRTVIEELERKKVTWSFISNGNVFTLNNETYLPDGLGQNHLFALEEALGRATYGIRQSLQEVSKSIAHFSSIQGILVLGTSKTGLTPNEMGGLMDASQGIVKYICVAGD